MQAILAAAVAKAVPAEAAPGEPPSAAPTRSPSEEATPTAAAAATPGGSAEASPLVQASSDAGTPAGEAKPRLRCNSAMLPKMTPKVHALDHG